MPSILIEPELGQQDGFDEQLFHKRELVDSLTRAIHERTNRMISDLRIDLNASEIVLWGRTRAYYYKQLASRTIQTELAGFRVVNEIQVL